jgi:hypothetical protein
MTRVYIHYLDHDKTMNNSLFLDRQFQESTAIELIPSYYQRNDGSKLTYLKGKFDIVMDAVSLEKQENN